ncbi:hypothetical protein AFCA_000828 [Aspergillus flavus]|nr:hypothetical protein NYO67_6354 [Aspergillus flavus]UCK57953.1 hypothetical protein AFCA_000828 [Aspergillus flavus]
MRANNLLLLAGLASSVAAYPADVESRTLGPLLEGIGKGIADIGEGVGEGIEDVTKGLADLISLLFGGSSGHTTVTILEGISAQAAAALQGGALGCTAGTIHADARAELVAWLKAHAEFDASLKAALVAWAQGGASATLSVDVCAGLSLFIPTCADIAAKGDLYVTLDGIFSATDLAAEVVLSASAQSSLSTFLSGHLGVGLDVDIRAGLGLCAGGGVVADLAADVKAALKAWLSGSECTLSHSLKVSVLAWLEGKVETGVVSIGSVPSGGLATISAGAAIGSLIEESGILVASAQASLSAFLEADIAADLEVEILTALKACAKGGLAADLSVEVRTALAIWLSGSSCRLGAELKSVVLFWLTFAVSADVAVDVSGGLLTDITSFLTGTVDTLIGTNLRGVISVLISGESLVSISLDARAQLAAVCGGAAGIEIDTQIILVIIQWLSGCDTGSGAHIRPPTSGSVVPSIPASTPVASTPAASTPLVPTPVPTSAGATGSDVPSVPAGSATTGVTSGVNSGSVVPTPSGPAPSDEASSTPCDTITSETVIGSATTEYPSSPAPTDVSPTGSESVSVPAVPTPSGPASSGPAPSDEASSTPCDTITSETVIASATTDVVPTGPAVTGVTSGVSSGSVVPTPSGPAPGEEASSTPCDTITSETVIASATTDVVPTGPAVTGVTSGVSSGSVVPTPSGPAPGEEASSTPCDTITSETVIASATTDVVPPAPTDVSPTGSESVSVPAVPTPSGPAPGEEASSTPCDTITSETVIASATTDVVPPAPTDVSPTGSESVSVPAVPTQTGPAGEAESTPCDTLTSETVYPVATETDAPSVSTTDVPPVITTAPAISSGPAPKVVTITTTVSVAVCEP